MKVDTPDILSEEEYREFWITFDNDEIRMGKAGEWEPLMMAPIPEPFKITHYGYSTGWGAIGWWQFHSKAYYYHWWEYCMLLYIMYMVHTYWLESFGMTVNLVVEVPNTRLWILIYFFFLYSNKHGTGEQALIKAIWVEKSRKVGEYKKKISSSS